MSKMDPDEYVVKAAKKAKKYSKLSKKYKKKIEQAKTSEARKRAKKQAEFYHGAAKKLLGVAKGVDKSVKLKKIVDKLKKG